MPDVAATSEPYGVMPYHYRDNGEPCPWSGTPGWTEGMVCHNGCEGSKGHYANDGHEECVEQPPLRRLERDDDYGPSAGKL